MEDSQFLDLEQIRNYRFQCLQIARQFQDEDSCVHQLADDASFLFEWIYAFEFKAIPEVNSDPESN